MAVVLSGGGANGAYEVGVLKALLKGHSPTTDFIPLDPEIITGTSVGAYNAAMLTAALESHDPPSAADYLESVWTARIPKDDGTRHNSVYRYRLWPPQYASPEYLAKHPLGPIGPTVEDLSFFASDWLQRGIQFLQSDRKLDERLLQLVDASSVISRQPSSRLFASTVDLPSIRDSSRQLMISASNWSTGRARIFRNKDMSDELGNKIIMASSALPGVFPSVDIGEHVYVDGGVLMNTPLAPALNEGHANELHIIYLDPDLSQMPLSPVENTLDTICRLFAVMFASQVNHAIEFLRNQDVDSGSKTDHRHLSQKLDITSLAPWDLAEQFAAYTRPGSRLVVHRYRPLQSLGNLAQLLDFRGSRMTSLIEQGYHDASTHDCQANSCITIGDA